jgi:hypothetical protein
MKTKLFSNADMAVRVVVIFLVLSGCTSVAAGGAQPDPAAVQLAASTATDLVRALGGKAKVEDGTVVLTDTVMLTEYVRLQTALTVPEGVTLDLSADGAGLELQDGAVLTVNGTVNATGYGDHGKGWVDGSIHIDDGAAVIAGTGTIYLKSKGRLLNIGSDQALRQLTLDGVTLVGLPDNDSSLVGIYENSELIMKSGAITGNTHTSDEWAGGGGVEVWKGKFTMEGGAITGNTVNGKGGSSGGGVAVGEGSVFTMTGGGISGNSAQGPEAKGGGVMDSGTFIMSGGTIFGNSAQGSGLSFGGGVIVADAEGSFILKGGRIQGSTTSEGFAANTISGGIQSSAALHIDDYEGTTVAKWGTGGTYTKGGVPQTGGSDIAETSGRYRQGGTDDTLIAIPAP